MLSIGTKKYRNLQDQVAYNTECIKKLDEYLDGITIEDKLVIIESDSGTLTDEELAILSGPLAFISDGSKVWMKQSETLVQLVFKAIEIVATEVGSAYFNLGLSQIVINRETGAYNSSADTFFTTYSKSQLDSIVANIMAVKANASDVYNKTQTYNKTEIDNALSLKANVSGQAFSGDITAPSIIENMSGYSFTPSAPENATVNHVYAGVVKNGNKITFVNFFEITLSSSGVGYINVGDFIIPEAVHNKLYPYDIGNVVNVLDDKVIKAFSSQTVSVDCATFIQKIVVGAKRVRPIFYTSNMSLNTLYKMRIEATFLLSDNLAQ